MNPTYHKTTGREIKVYVSYNIGGMNYFTGSVEQRGYYLHCTPVDRRENGGEIVTAFTGAKQLLLEVKRKSKKAEQKAIELAKVEENELIQHVCNKNNLTLINETN